MIRSCFSVKYMAGTPRSVLEVKSYRTQTDEPGEETPRGCAPEPVPLVDFYPDPHTTGKTARRQSALPKVALNIPTQSSRSVLTMFASLSTGTQKLVPQTLHLKTRTTFSLFSSGRPQEVFLREAFIPIASIFPQICREKGEGRNPMASLEPPPKSGFSESVEARSVGIANGRT